MKKVKKIIKTALTFVLVSFFISCSSKSNSVSFNSKLDTIDALILQSDETNALKELKSLEKESYSTNDYLSLYKRYSLLGKIDLQEKCLQKGLKKQKGNKELSAVYTQLLLNQNRLKEACKIASVLENSNYSSIYAECILKQSLLEENVDFTDSRFIPLYEKAGNNTDLSFWNVNAAYLYLKQNDIESALKLVPKSFSSPKDCLFWGILFYDNKYYQQSLDCLLQYTSLLCEPSDLIHILSLQADNYYIMDDMVSSEICREQIKSVYQENKNNLSMDLKSKVALTYINSLLYSMKNQEYLQQFHNCDELVKQFPDYLPGIALYTEFAIQNIHVKDEDELSQVLRKAGFRTLKMEETDNLPTITVEQAFERLDKYIAATNSREAVATKAVLQDILNPSQNKALQSAKLWQLLERNSIQNDFYGEALTHYSVCKLINLNQSQEAIPIMANYIATKYQNTPIECYKQMNLWEMEYCAYLYAVQNQIFEAYTIYSYIIDEYDDSKLVNVNESFRKSLIKTLTNLAIINLGYKDSDSALQHLNKANTLSVDPIEKSEILYRIAYISAENHDTKSAIRTLQYALQLNDDNNKARLLLKSILE